MTFDNLGPSLGLPKRRSHMDRINFEDNDNDSIFSSDLNGNFNLILSLIDFYLNFIASADLMKHFQAISKLEKDEYLKHLGNLRLAHKVELQNEKMLLINLIEELVNNRLTWYGKAVDDELQNIFAHVSYLNRLVAEKESEIKSLRKLVIETELRTVVESIDHKYDYKFIEPPPKVSKYNTLFYELQDMIVDHLQYIRAIPHVK